MYLENNEIRHYPIRAILSWVLVAIWMALIFFLSHQPAEQSGMLSTGLAERFILFFRGELSADRVEKLDGILRSMAHGLIFYMLGLFLAWAFFEVHIRDLRNAAVTLAVGLLYAGSDEWHQSLVVGRASQWSDFFTDGLGILIAVLMVQIFAAWRYLRSDLRVKREEDLRI